jgi:hypothetical protein
VTHGVETVVVCDPGTDGVVRRKVHPTGYPLEIGEVMTSNASPRRRLVKSIETVVAAKTDGRSVRNRRNGSKRTH